jgi:hypothetical protein
MRSEGEQIHSEIQKGSSELNGKEQTKNDLSFL